jgi:hypothetical protein
MFEDLQLDQALESKESIEVRLESWKSSAFKRGTDPRNRALEAGRRSLSLDASIERVSSSCST